MSGSVSDASRRVSSASSAWTSVKRLSSAETPSRRWRGVGRATGHGQAERDRPGVGHDDVEVGRLRDDREVAGDASADGGERALSAVFLGRDQGDDQLTGEAVQVAARPKGPDEARIAATPPFMSLAPRP